MSWLDKPTNEQKVLRSIGTALDSPPDDMGQNLICLNKAVSFQSGMIDVLQNGVNDANRDILLKIQDAIEDLLIIFGFGSSGDTLNFEWGELATLLRNFTKIFNLGWLSGGDWEDMPFGTQLGWIKAIWDATFGRFLGMGNSSWDPLKPLYELLTGVGGANKDGAGNFLTSQWSQITNANNTANSALSAAQGAIDSAVQIVINGLNNIGQAADPILSAIDSLIDAIFGSGTSSGSTPVVRWSQEVLLCAGPVTTGPNDIPLGFQSPYGAVITSINARSSDHLSTGSGSKIVMQTLKNGTVIHTATWNGGNNTYSSGALNLTGINTGDVITFNVTEASSQMANMSVTVAGRYS